MGKRTKIILGITVLAVVAVAALPITRDELHWKWSSSRDESKDYAGYLKSWHSGRHATEAKELYDERSWSDAQAEKTVQSFERYLQIHGHGKYVAEAKDSIESLHWQEATSANTFKSFQHYIDAYPNGRFANQAKSKQTSLLADDAPFLEARKKGTENAFKTFLAQFPGHKRESDVHAILKDLEGRDIVDLLEEKKVDIETQGSGIKFVSLKVRRLVEHPITVRVPIGTFFVSRNTSSQNMVTTAETKLTITGDDWVSLTPSAACANRSRNIPGGSDSFAVQRSPNQAELARLIPILDKAGVEYAVRQAAVWIVTDNADYGDLGSLVIRSQFQFYGGSRTIREKETARAMKLCEEAGIDITSKAIWQNRRKILDGLEDGELKMWLEEKK